VRLEVLAPSLPLLADTGDDINENSIVVMLRADGSRDSFMGDAGEANEGRLFALVWGGDAPLVARKRPFERLLGDR
jgi:beta-lactamase superfamily II metal-dependent hydrolase